MTAVSVATYAVRERFHYLITVVGGYWLGQGRSYEWPQIKADANSFLTNNKDRLYMSHSQYLRKLTDLNGIRFNFQDQTGIHLHACNGRNDKETASFYITVCRFK